MNTSFLHEIQFWYTQPTGRAFLEQECQLLNKIWPQCFGEYLLQLGFTPQLSLLTQASHVRQPIYLTPHLIFLSDIVANFAALPFATESIDVLLIHHGLGILENSQQIIEEAHRVLMPSGKIIICGIAPARYWKYYDRFQKRQRFPHSLHSVTAMQAKKLLNAAGFVTDSLLYHSHGLSLQLQDNKVTSTLATGLRYLQHLPFIPGGGYILVGQKNVAAMTPIMRHCEGAPATAAMTLF